MIRIPNIQRTLKTETAKSMRYFAGSVHWISPDSSEPTVNLTSFEVARRETNPVRASCSQETFSVRWRPMDCSVGESRLPSLVHDDHVINDEVIDVAAAPATVIASFDVQYVTCWF